MEFKITQQWDGKPTGHNAISVRMEPNPIGIQLNVTAPLFNDPEAPSHIPAGQPCPQLWDYEVVEVFLLAPDEKYLEVELCPHGQHLVLLLNGCRNMVKDQLPLDYMAKIIGDTWKGEAVIPFDYLPVGVNKFNAYAIHGSGSSRMYEALYCTPHGKYTTPDFHRLEYFKDLDIASLLPKDHMDGPSELWQNVTE